jgi:hypothetical protein
MVSAESMDRGAIRLEDELMEGVDSDTKAALLAWVSAKGEASEASFPSTIISWRKRVAESTELSAHLLESEENAKENQGIVWDSAYLYREPVEM